MKYELEHATSKYGQIVLQFVILKTKRTLFDQNSFSEIDRTPRVPHFI